MYIFIFFTFLTTRRARRAAGPPPDPRRHHARPMPRKGRLLDHTNAVVTDGVMQHVATGLDSLGPCDAEDPTDTEDSSHVMTPD